MANDSTNTGQHTSVQDATPNQDSFFINAGMDEETFFGPEQLAQVTGEPVKVAVPQNEHVIRVQVTPGEVLELASPFDGGVELLAREANGNLAIKVGDVTVILQGFVAANDAAPVVVETSDGKPIDIATLLASTDPAIDIQTAAGPGEGNQGGQGADNTGAILAQLQGGNGLGGLNAVGTQDGTSLNYGLIDNSIRQELLDTPTTLLSATGFKGVSEPFLRDPVHHGAFVDFDTFFSQYDAYVTNHPGGAWADFTGTAATDTDFADYLSQTSFTSVIGHGSASDEPIRIDQGALQDFLDDTANGGANPITSDGSHLCVVMADGGATAFVIRESDHALILVLHAHAAGDPDATSGTGNYEIDTYLIDRLDHPDQGQDILGLEIPYLIQPQGVEEQETPPITGSTTVDILDDIPVAGDPAYLNFLHASSFKDAADCFSAFLGGKITDVVVTHDAGHVDEDFIFGGNHDKDNANGPDSDAARGDDVGDRFVLGLLNINFGADGPSGAIPNGDGFPPKGDPVFQDATPPALAIDGYKVNDEVPGLTSQGHELVVLKHEMLPFPFSTVEMVQVGYHPDGEGEESFSGEGGHCDTVVFTLLLQTGPNLPLFGGFVFEQSAPLDHPVADTLESNLSILFPIIATDDDGDHPIDPVNITIQVNDDAPSVDITYYSDKHCCGGDEVSLLTVNGLSYPKPTHDFGHADEDWLQGAVGNTAWGNQDQGGDGKSNAGEYGDDTGYTHVFGDIKGSYGADGPGSATAGLKVYDSSGVDFQNTDGSTVSSHGHTLQVLSSDGANLTVGYDDGESAVTVFTLTLNAKTGHFDFCLFEPLDHDNKLGGPESNILLTFSAGSITDFDKDTAEAVIKIQVNDDKPEIETVYYNNLLGEGGGDHVGDAALSKQSDTTYDYGHVDEDWLASGNQDENAAGGSNAGKFGDDIGKTVVTGHLAINYGGDGPGDTSDTTLNLTSLSKDDAFNDANGNPLSSNGNPLFVLESDNGHISVGYGDTVVFTLTLKGDSGDFTFTLLQPLDHPLGDGKESNLPLSFEVTSPATDFDDDQAVGAIKILVNDDMPEAGISYTNHKDTSEDSDFVTTSYGLVDEDFLGDPPANTDNDNNPFAHQDSKRGDTFGTNSLYGHVNVSYGGDGPGSTDYALKQLTPLSSFRDEDGNLVKQGGVALVVLDSTATHLAVGLAPSTGHPDGVVVFELNFDATSGNFNFQLYGPLDENPGNTHPIENNLMLAFALAGPTDADGDPANEKIRIQVNDDAPVAKNIDAGCDYSGNVFTFAHEGADGATVTAIKYNGSGGKTVSVDQDGSDTVVLGKYGALAIHDDGTWSYYTPTTPSFKDGTDTFTYTIKDADGDSATATLKIEALGPTHTVGKYDHSFDVTSNLDLSKFSDSFEVSDVSGSGHAIAGGSKGDHLLGNSGNDILAGNGGNDILEGGSGNDGLTGGSNDDTLYGGSGNDVLFGGSGHDAMSGGSGNDLFQEVDADDLAGTNTLDGTHTIDGGIDLGSGDTDIAQLGGLTTFGLTEAARIENFEVLDFKTGGANPGTAVTLDYGAVYGITQIGGLHALTIHADTAGGGKDTVTLQNGGGHDWTFAGNDGTYDTYTAGTGGAQVTVHIDQGTTVQTA